MALWNPLCSPMCDFNEHHLSLSRCVHPSCLNQNWNVTFCGLASLSLPPGPHKLKKIWGRLITLVASLADVLKKGCCCQTLVRNDDLEVATVHYQTIFWQSFFYFVFFVELLAGVKKGVLDSLFVIWILPLHKELLLTGSKTWPEVQLKNSVLE